MPAAACCEGLQALQANHLCVQAVLLAECVLVPHAFCAPLMPLQVSSLGLAALAGFTAAGGATLMWRSRWAGKARVGMCGPHGGGCRAQLLYRARRHPSQTIGPAHMLSVSEHVV